MHKCAIVLAGGKGTRLKPLTDNLPKPMVPVAGQPFLYWQLRYLKEQGIEDVLLLVSYMADVIRDHFTKHPMPGLNIKYSIEEEPLGTGGAIKNAASLLPETFFVVNGDSFLFIDLEAMAEHHDRAGFDGTLAVANPEAVPVPANLKCADGRVTEYQKGAGVTKGFTHVDAGLYLLKKNIVASSPEGAFDISTYWPPAIQRRKLGAFQVWDRFFDIGTIDRLEFFEQHLKDYF